MGFSECMFRVSLKYSNEFKRCSKTELRPVRGSVKNNRYVFYFNDFDAKQEF